MRLTPPLKWPGGKNYLATKIVARMPPHLHYVEPYAGGLAVLLAKDPEGVSEVVNDLHGDLTTFWCVLQNESKFQKFLRCVEATPFSEAQWEAAGDLIKNINLLAASDSDAAVIRAWAFFVRCRQSLAGRMDSFSPLSRTRVRRGMNEQTSAWLNAAEGLPAVHERLKRVVVLNRSALDVIHQQDGENTLFYLDPPYPHETRATTGEYAHEMTHEDHSLLLQTLVNIKGKFLLSSYPNELYDKEAASWGWRRETFDLPNNAAGGEEKRRMTEVLYMNY